MAAQSRWQHENPATLGAFVSSLGRQENRELHAAVAHFGAERELVSILPEDVRRWLRSGGDDRDARRRALGGLYRAAQARGVVPIGFDPSSVFQHLACPGDQIGITEFLSTYRTVQASHLA